MRFKYDKRGMKCFFIAACILTGLVILAALGLLIEEAAPYAYLLMIFLIPVALGCWAGYLDSLQYIRRLQKWGIEVPELKEELLIPPPQCTELAEDGEVCRYSVVLACMAFCVCAGIFLWAVLHVRHYAQLGVRGDATFVACLFGIPFFGAWLIGGLVYYHQRLNSLFKDEADPIPYKKKRTRLVNGCITIVIALLITIGLLHCARSMTEYVYRSRLETAWGDEWRVHVGEPLP